MDAIVTGKSLATLIRDLYTAVVQTTEKRDRKSFEIICDIHPIFERVHYNYTDIFRQLFYDLKTNKTTAMKNFLASRSKFEPIRSDLRSTVGALLKDNYSNYVGRYIFCLAFYFLYEEHHGVSPSAIDIFYQVIGDDDRFLEVGDRYFDTPSMRLARQISKEISLDRCENLINFAIAGLSMKRQNVLRVYYQAMRSAKS